VCWRVMPLWGRKREPGLDDDDCSHKLDRVRDVDRPGKNEAMDV
jgi:hypothetical protein